MAVEPGGDPHDDVGDDGLGDFAPRIVGGHPDPIGQPRGDAAHQGPLATIPITSAAEDHGQPGPGGDEPPRRREDALERVRRVGVVHDHEEGLPRLHPLEASRHRVHGAEG